MNKDSPGRIVTSPNIDDFHMINKPMRKGLGNLALKTFNFRGDDPSNNELSAAILPDWIQNLDPEGFMSPLETVRGMTEDAMTFHSNEGRGEHQLSSMDDKMKGPMDVLSMRIDAGTLGVDGLSPFIPPDYHNINPIHDPSQERFELLESNNEEEDMFDLLGSFGIPQSISQVTSSALPPHPNLATSSTYFQPLDWQPPLPRTTHAKHTPDWDYATTPSPRRKHSLLTQNFVSEANLQTLPTDHDRRPRRAAVKPHEDLGSLHESIKILFSYPQFMVESGFYPPFVHHNIYQCSTGNVLEPLAAAFCCIGAFNASVPSSQPFIHTMINTERSRLVKSFGQWSKSTIDTLAAVHAMAVYQILGFFGRNQDQNRTAEEQHPFFLKMARKLAQLHLDHSPNARDQEDAESRWRCWILNETIRRTLFLVNIINWLSYSTYSQNQFFFEALDNALLLELPLPAPEAQWRASLAVDWIAAKEATVNTIPLTPRLVIGHIRSPDGYVTLDNRLSPATGEQRVRGGAIAGFKYSLLDEFTRLAVESVQFHLS